jgi:signal transduction histidine kinase
VRAGAAATAPETDDLEARLEEFAARTAHQLGNGVSLVSASVAVGGEAGRGLVGGPQARRSLEAGLERLRRVVSDLSELSFWPCADVRLASVDPSEPLAAALELLRTDLREAGARVACRALPTVRADGLALQRMFVHLLRAALAAAQDEPPRIEVRGGAGANGLHEIVVADRVPLDGGLVPAHAFDALAPPRGRGPLVGGGVSLQVCRRIAERLGGRIRAEARPGGGTIVVISLPAADA